MKEFELSVPELLEECGAARAELPEIPEWLHEECRRRARIQWMMMLRFTGYDSVAREYLRHPISEKVTEDALRTLKAIKSLYEEPIHDPDGNEIQKTEDVWAWWDEYAMQASMFPDNVEYEEAMKEVTDYYRDGKRFTVGRWFDAMGDRIEAREMRESGGLN